MVSLITRVSTAPDGHVDPEVPGQSVGSPQPLARHHDGAAAAGGGLQRDGDQPADQSEVSSGSRDRSSMIHLFHNWFSQSRRRPLLGLSPGGKRLLALSHLRHY